MNSNWEICNMKIKSAQFILLRAAPLFIGIFLTGVLYLVNYYNFLHLNYEIIFSPLIVIPLLAYAESLLILLMVAPFWTINKIVESKRNAIKHVNQILTYKQS